MSDFRVVVAMWGAFAALSTTLFLLAAVLALRVRLLNRLTLERDVTAFWIPLIARCAETRPATLPPLKPRDADDFVLLWCRAMDPLAAEPQERLRDMALRLGADKHARRMLQSHSMRRRLVATVALGHLGAQDLVPNLQTQIASSPPMPSLVGARALIRINPSAGVRTVLSVAARREDWPIASVASMLKECSEELIAPALASAIRLAISRGDDNGVARLLRLHITVEAPAIRDAVRDVLAACSDTEVLAAALSALSNAGDIAHARRLLAHPEWFVRVAAARALGRLGDENDVARLTTALRDSSWWVRHRAAQALSQLPGMDTPRLADIAGKQTDRYAADMLRHTLAEEVRHVIWQAVADVATWFFLAYFAVLGVGSFLLHACSLLEVPRQLEVGLPELLPRPHSGYEPPVSVIMPACHAKDKVTSTVNAVLKLDYPEFEVVVVNDGSIAGMLEALIREFSLVRFPVADRRRIDTRPVHGVYRSSRFPNLRVIDKEDGGKADAANAGINAARYPLVCVVDADSILERSSLRRVVLPFLTERNTIAAGGCVRIADGCEVRDGFLEDIGLPRRVLPMAQVVEYLRAFLFGRLGWAPLNAVPVVSGTFGVFRAESVVAAGGYRQDTLGEDMELVMRLHRLNRLAGKPYRISFLLSPVAWKSAPASAAALRDQRIRWQRGLGESLSRNRELLFHRRGGAPGWLMMPFMVTFELFGPLIELSGYLFMLIGVLCGFVSPPVFWSFLLLVVSLGVLLSISALLLEEVSCHIYVRRGNLLALVCMAIIENFGYHQLVLWWRLQGIYQWVTRSVKR